MQTSTVNKKCVLTAQTKYFRRLTDSGKEFNVIVDAHEGIGAPKPRNPLPSRWGVTEEAHDNSKEDREQRE